MAAGAGRTQEEIDQVLHALADGTRRDVLVRAADRVESVSALARAYPISLPAVQKRVAVLERAGPVVKVRRGREQRVHPDPERIRAARALLEDHEALWRHRVSAVDRLLAKDPDDRMGNLVPVFDVEHDLDDLTPTVTAFFAAPVEAVWDLYADPRTLERHRGPPRYPATSVEHRLEPGSRSHHLVTGPDGEEPHGVWNVLDVDEPHRFDVADAFADAEGNPDEETGWNRMRADLQPVDGGTRLVLTSTSASVDQMRQMLDMGMEEGLKAAMGQIDALLTEQPA